MDEGREDRTQMEDVITIPKTDHKVRRNRATNVGIRDVRTNTWIREPISGISVSTTDPARASS